MTTIQIPGTFRPAHDGDPVARVADIEGAVATTDDRLSSSAGSDLAAAVAIAGSTHTDLIIAQQLTVSANLTVPSTIHMRVTRRGLITVAEGLTLTVLAPFEAGEHTCFAGTGSVVFGAGSVSSVHARWFGSDGAAVQAAVDAAARSIKHVSVAPGVYLFDAPLQFPVGQLDWGVELTGAKCEDKYQALPGSYSTVFRANSSIDSLVTMRTESTAGYYHVLRNVVLDGAAKATLGYVNGYQDKFLDSCVLGCTGTGIALRNLTNDTYVSNVTATLCGVGQDCIDAYPSGAMFVNCKFRQNIGAGISLASGVQLRYIGGIVEANGGCGVEITKGAAPLECVNFEGVHFEANGDYSVYQDGVWAVTYRDCMIAANAADKCVKVVSGSAAFYDCAITGVNPSAENYFYVAPLALVSITAHDTGDPIIVVSGGGSVNYSGLTWDTTVPGSYISQSHRANILRRQVNVTSSRSLLVDEVCGTLISNAGQGAENVSATLPTATKAFEFDVILGTAQGANYFRLQTAGNNVIFLDGSPTPQASVTCSPATVGSALRVQAFTGAAYYWIATTVAGTWT